MGTLNEYAVDGPMRGFAIRLNSTRSIACASVTVPEHRQPALGDLDTDVLEVVDPRALDADEVVQVGRVHNRQEHSSHMKA